MQVQSFEYFCEACGAGNPAQASTCWHCQKPLSSSAKAVPPSLPDGPLVAGRYQLCRPLGQGGMGSVYLALDQHQQGLPVALKQIHKGGLNAQQRAELELSLQREADLLRALRHPAIPRLHTYWSELDYSYLVLEYIDGETLEQYLQRRSGQPLPLRQVLIWGLQICDALAYLHQQEPPIIYRDLKPANIMLRRQDGRLLLIDFGIARRFRAGQARDTTALGSPGFAAPEQYGKAQTTPRSDLYSLGVLLHSLLSGLDPSEQSPCFAPLRQLNPAVPEALEQLIAALVSLDPQERPASAEEVRRQLASFLRRPGLSQSEATASATGAVAPAAPSPTLKRRRLLRLGLGTAVAAAAVGSVPLGRWLWSQLLPGQGDDTPLAVQPIDAIQALAWSPDGAHIAAGQWPIEEGGVAFIWSTDLHETLLTYNGHHGGVLSVAWSPNSSQIASGSSDHSVQVWDASNGSTLLIYQGHRDSVPGVAWSPNGRLIASGSFDRTVQIWDAISGETQLSYRIHQEKVYSLGWSPDGSRIASGSLEGAVLVWNAATGQTLWNCPIMLVDPVISWSPDGSQLAIGGDNGQVLLWEAATGALVRTYKGHSGPVYCVAWAPNGRWIASGGADNLQIWEAQSGHRLRSYPHESEGIRALAWSPDSQRLIMAGTRIVKLWQVSL